MRNEQARVRASSASGARSGSGKSGSGKSAGTRSAAKSVGKSSGAKAKAAKATEDERKVATTKGASVKLEEKFQALTREGARGSSGVGVALPAEDSDAARERRPLESYFQEIGGTRTLKREEEVFLAKELEDATAALRDALYLVPAAARHASWRAGTVCAPSPIPAPSSRKPPATKTRAKSQPESKRPCSAPASIWSATSASPNRTPTGETD